MWVQGARGNWGVLLAVGGQQPEPHGCVEPLQGGEAAAGARPPLQPPYLSPASRGGGAAGWPGRGAWPPAATLPAPHTCKRRGVGAQGAAILTMVGGQRAGVPYHGSGSPSRNPLAKGLLAIFSWVICGGERGQGIPGRGPSFRLAGAHPVVLVGCHCHELGLGEAEGLEVLVGEALAVAPRVHKHDVEAGLVAVHGVEDDLGVGKRRWQDPPREGCIVSPPPPSPQQGPHVAVVVQEVVGQLELVEGHDLPHPLGTLGGGVGVEVDAARSRRLGPARRQPG